MSKIKKLKNLRAILENLLVVCAGLMIFSMFAVVLYLTFDIEWAATMASDLCLKLFIAGILLFIGNYICRACISKERRSRKKPVDYSTVFVRG